MRAFVCMPFCQPASLSSSLSASLSASLSVCVCVCVRFRHLLPTAALSGTRHSPVLPASALAFPLPHWAHPRHISAGTKWAHPVPDAHMPEGTGGRRICADQALSSATSAPRLGAPSQRRHHNDASRCHICTGTERLFPPRLHPDLAASRHICAGTGRTPPDLSPSCALSCRPYAHICTGTALPGLHAFEEAPAACAPAHSGPHGVY